LNRWEVVANFVNQHTKSDLKRNAKEVLARAKSLSTTDASTLKTAVNQQAYSKFEQSHKPAPVSNDTSVRTDEAEAGELSEFTDVIFTFLSQLEV
jgi:DnaJ family protein C protein 2